MGRVLLVDVGGGVLPVGQRPALRYELGVQVLGAGAAHRHDATVAVDVALIARQDPLSEVIGQGERRLLAASVCLPAGLERLLDALAKVER